MNNNKDTNKQSPKPLLKSAAKSTGDISKDSSLRKAIPVKVSSSKSETKIPAIENPFEALVVDAVHELPSVSTYHSVVSVVLEKKMGEYSNWTAGMHILSTSGWFEFDALREWCKMANAMRFYLKTDRDNIRLNYTRMQVNSRLFSRTTRFPSSGIYVNLSSGCIADAVRSILASCDTPDRAINKDHVAIDLSDAHKAFLAAVDKLNTNMNVFTDQEMIQQKIFSRESFEKTFGLIWVENQA